MSYLRYFCLFVYSGVQHIFVLCFLFCLSSSCVQNVAFCGLSILERLFHMNIEIKFIMHS